VQQAACDGRVHPCQQHDLHGCGRVLRLLGLGRVMLRYGSVCSGVEAATAAWHPLGWQPQWFSEIEAFPSAVLAHHYPDTPNHGDMTTFKEWPDDPIDLLVGGTPCQSFSVAGLRKGLDDPRGNLMLTYLAIAERYQPRWLVWENVPGVLSSNRGRDFGTFLGALGQLGYGFAYRVLDAQYFGVAQRRRRVFVVGYLGDWRRAAAVLFERESLSGHPAPRRETREEVAAFTTSSIADYREGCGTLRAHGGDLGGGSETVIAFGAQNSANQGDSVSEHVTPTLDKSKTPAVAHTLGTQCSWATEDGTGRGSPLVPSSMAVRRLTPIECERLQGFPDDYTLIPYRNRMAADGPRYKAMGNSMAVPVMRWIGERISEVDAYDQ
jgi:DNA (cytosine-5)-methyltransferase 1